MAARKALTDTDWVVAGFEALMHRGAQGIKAESLAKDLKVSKGSFYWHFADVASLKRAMLDQWSSMAENQLLTAQQSANTPREQLLYLIDLQQETVTGKPAMDHRVESAIRDWSRFDADAAVTVRSTDSKRLDLLAQVFNSMGITKSKSRISACTFYAALLGIEEIARNTEVDKKRCALQAMEGILVAHA